MTSLRSSVTCTAVCRANATYWKSLRVQLKSAPPGEMQCTVAVLNSPKTATKDGSHEVKLSGLMVSAELDFIDTWKCASLAPERVMEWVQLALHSTPLLACTAEQRARCLWWRPPLYASSDHGCILLAGMIARSAHSSRAMFLTQSSSLLACRCASSCTA